MSVGQVFPEQYQELLDSKVSRIKENFSLQGLNLPNAPVFTSEPSHYRMRAEFRVWHQEDDSYYIMFNPETREKIRIDEFPVGGEQINILMVSLREKFLHNPILRQKLYQVEFLTSTKGQALVSMIYHRKLEDDWLLEAQKLESELQVKIIGRSKKQKVLVSDNWIQESFTVDGKIFNYLQYENSFTQPNAGVAQKMLQWACDQSESLSGDLLELYCGIGNFTLPLSQHFDAVTATEIAKLSIKTAKMNADINNISNIEFLKASSEEYSQNWLKAGQQGKHLNTLFVDPPRAGLDPDTVDLARHFDQIIYISCNPDTLLDNCKSLSNEFTIQEFAFFDQFPYTHHMECGALLIKKQA